MYELALLAGIGAVTYRAFTKHTEEEPDIPHKIGERMGRLWDVVHQGMRENRLLRAEKALLTILKIDEKNAAAYNRLGILYAKQKEFKDAIDCFEIACSIEPTASSLHNLGLIYYETENYQKAVTAFEEAIKLEDTMAARHIALAKALERTGNTKQMIEELEIASDLEPSHEVFTMLERTYRSMDMPEKADLIEDRLKKMKVPSGKRRTRIRRPSKRVVV